MSTDNVSITIVDSQIVDLQVYTENISLSFEQSEETMIVTDQVIPIKGDKGNPGIKGSDGLTAYEVWLEAGHTGTEEDFFQYLKGIPGLPAKINGVNTLTVLEGNGITVSQDGDEISISNSSIEDGTSIKNKLSGLTGDQRLDASAIKNIPTLDLTPFATKADLSSGLNTKAPTIHNHSISQVEGLDEVLNSKLEASDLPSKTSQLTNDSGFITEDAIPTDLSAFANDSHFITASDIPAIPSKTSQLTNDAGFLTSVATPNATAIPYANVTYPTVAAALDKLLYVNPVITLTPPATVEVGTTITSVTLTWTLNKNVTSLSLNNEIGSIDPQQSTYTQTGLALTSDTSYTITAYDGSHYAYGTASQKFYHKRYYGVSSKDTLTNSDILALSSELSTSRTQTRTFNCSGGKYFYFAILASYCSGISFKVGGLLYNDMNIVANFSFTNASGYTALFNVYRSGSIQTGSAISVEVL